MTGVTIVSPGYPDQPGGVTDHTARLCRHWTEQGHTVRVWSDSSQPAASSVAGWHQAGTRAVLVQYVPFLYGRTGVSQFPERIAVEARRLGMRVTTFVHEPWVPPTRLPWLVLRVLQRRQLRRIVDVCDAIVTPVPKWASQFGSKAQVIYVGNTLGDSAQSPNTADPLPAPVVFSPFAAGLDWPWIISAIEAIRAEPELIVIGASEVTAVRHPVLRRYVRPGWGWHDHAPSRSVLALLGRSRLVLAPFVDGLTGRRTSAMAAASTGTAVLSSEGQLYDPWFRNSPFVTAQTKHEYAAKALQAWHTPASVHQQRIRRQWYIEHLDARELDESLAAIMLRGQDAWRSGPPP